jgi:predicted nucleic acid-binding protein
LAIELQAGLVLLDEHEARRAAARLGLNVLGVLGVLLAAKVSGELDQVRPWLDALRQQAGFFLSEALYQAVLGKASETS